MKNNMLEKPLVSIICDVYNHGPYLRQCLDGFIMQETTFPIEILIHDDASTDDSQEIIKEYYKKYPVIIKPIIQKENQYSKGIGIWKTYQFPRVEGKYIAICEGDDYWTDPLKLQKQVDFLENHPAYSCCVHETQKLYQDKGCIYKAHKILQKNPNGFSFDLNYHGWLIHPLTLVFRKNAIDYEKYNRCKKTRDNTLVYFLLKAGKAFLSPEIMSVYRIHSSGICSGASYDTYFLSTLEYESYIIDVDNCEESQKCLFYTLKENLYNLILHKNCKAFKKAISYSKKYLNTIETIKILIALPFQILIYSIKIVLNKLIRNINK